MSKFQSRAIFLNALYVNKDSTTAHDKKTYRIHVDIPTEKNYPPLTLETNWNTMIGDYSDGENLLKTIKKLWNKTLGGDVLIIPGIFTNYKAIGTKFDFGEAGLKYVKKHFALKLDGVDYYFDVKNDMKKERMFDSTIKVGLGDLMLKGRKLGEHEIHINAETKFYQTDSNTDDFKNLKEISMKNCYLISDSLENPVHIDKFKIKFGNAVEDRENHFKKLTSFNYAVALIKFQDLPYNNLQVAFFKKPKKMNHKFKIETVAGMLKVDWDRITYKTVFEMGWQNFSHFYLGTDYTEDHADSNEKAELPFKIMRMAGCKTCASELRRKDYRVVCK